MTVVLLSVPNRAPAFVAQLEAIAASLAVVVCAFTQPREVRAARTRREPVDDAARDVLTDEQRTAFARAEVLLAWDLPFDVGELAPDLRLVQGMSAGLD